MRQSLASLSAISVLLFGDISSAMNIDGPGDSGQASGQRAAKTAISESDYKDWFASAENGDIDKMKSLMRKGIDVNYKDEWHRTALEIAADYGRAEVVDLLLFTTEKVLSLLNMYRNKQGIDDKDLKRHLFSAVEYGRALVSAAKEEHMEMVELLLNRGVDVNSQDEWGDTALMGAAAGGDPETVRLLLERGADINSRNDDGDTVLMWAASGGNPETVRLLLERGADVNSRNNNGETALMEAVTEVWEHTETVRLLLDRGADPNIQDSRGRTALYWAREKHDSEVISLLEEALRKTRR